MYSLSGNTCRKAEGEASQGAGSVGTLAQERSRKTMRTDKLIFANTIIIVSPSTQTTLNMLY
jgi:hypothetical protein